MSSAEPVPIDPGDYTSVTWLGDERLVVAYDPQGLLETKSGLWQPRVDGSHLQQLVTAADPRCNWIEDAMPQRLPNGRVGFLRTCPLRDWTTPPMEQHLMAYDVDLETAETVADPGCAVSQYSWNPDATKAVFGCGSKICQGIGFASADGVKPIDVVVGEGDRAFALAAHFEDDADCTPTGRADLPAWRPDGEQIAFFASPQSVGVDGQARLDERWNLYLMAPDGRRLEELLTDIGEPTSLAWSADGSWLAFTSEPSDDGGKAILFAPSTHELLPFSTDRLWSLAWAPSGDRIAAVRDPGVTREWGDRQLVIFDVTDLTLAMDETEP